MVSKTLEAPDGVIVERVVLDPPLAIPRLVPSFVVSRKPRGEDNGEVGFC